MDVYHLQSLNPLPSTLPRHKAGPLKSGTWDFQGDSEALPETLSPKPEKTYLF